MEHNRGEVTEPDLLSALGKPNASKTLDPFPLLGPKIRAHFRVSTIPERQIISEGMRVVPEC